MKSKFEVKGLEDYLEVLQKTGQDINIVSRSALQEAAQILKSAMISRVPVGETKNLRDHILIFTPSAEGDFNYVIVGIIMDIGYTDAKTAIYANSVEFGSVHAGARPYIRPAIRSTKSAITRLIRDRLKAASLID